MKKSTIGIALAFALSSSALAISTTAYAKAGNYKFTSTISAQTAPVRVNVVLGEDLAYRADHVSKKLSDRSGSRSLHDGWSGKGEYGQRDLDNLTKRLKRKMEAQLTKNGVHVSDTAANVLNIMITDAQPNRPTFKQLSGQPSLSMSSFGVGGARFEGNFVANGQDAGKVSYAWFESDIRYAQYGSTWRDANYAIDKFARKTAKSIK